MSASPLQCRNDRLRSTAEVPYGKIVLELYEAQIHFVEGLVPDVSYHDRGFAEAQARATDLGSEQDIQVTFFNKLGAQASEVGAVLLGGLPCQHALHYAEVEGAHRVLQVLRLGKIAVCRLRSDTKGSCIARHGHKDMSQEEPDANAQRSGSFKQ